MSEPVKNELPTHLQSNPQLARCYYNLHDHDLSELIIIAGRTGFGKSCTGLYGMLALDFGKSITPNGHTFFSRFDLSRCYWIAKDFIDSMVKQKKDNSQWFLKGTCFMFDEINVEASNLEFQSIKGKATVTALQTNRKYNYCVFMTTPAYKSMNIGLRRLATAVIEIKEKIKRNGKPYARALFKWVDYDSISGDDYKKYHRSAVPQIIDYDEEGRPVIVYRRKRYKTILIPLIPKKLEEEYNVLKDISMKRNRENIMEQFEYYKKYLGETGLKVKRANIEDLKKQFLKEDGGINWEKIVANGKVYRDLVEQGIEKVDNLATEKEIRRVLQWLQREYAILRESGAVVKSINRVKTQKAELGTTNQ